MSLFPSILYPTDLSPCAEAARPLALEFARQGERLHLLYVDHLFGGAEHAVTVRQRLARMGDEAPVPFDEAIARDIAPAAAILRYAEEHGVDLIVMGTHGRRGLPRLLLGSTAREVVQLAPCPVLTVRSGLDDDHTSLRDGAILVAVDFSEASREALRQAVRLAETFDARIDLVHAIDDVFVPVDSGYTLRSIYEMDPEVEERQREALRVFRTEVADDLERFGTVDVREGAPVDVITDAAEQFGSSLIVLGTKGLRGLGNLVMGSVAGAVVRTAPCPVLTVKAADATASAREAIQEARETSVTSQGDTPLSIDSALAF
jgi:nucleotide-binding universal stress UspA family protein